jgi:hypothetical protein
LDALDPKLRGVRGWLLLLCLNLVVFDPTAVLLNLFMSTGSTASDFDRHPELLRLSLVAGVPMIALMVFSLYAGLCLWRVAPGAVAIARKYLICLFFFSVFSLFLPDMVGVTEKAHPGMSAANTFGVVVTTVHVAAWYLYLNLSKRVKATYAVDETGTGQCPGGQSPDE